MILSILKKHGSLCQFIPLIQPISSTHIYSMALCQGMRVCCKTKQQGVCSLLRTKKALRVLSQKIWVAYIVNCLHVDPSTRMQEFQKLDLHSANICIPGRWQLCISAQSKLSVNEGDINEMNSLKTLHRLPESKY